MKVHFTSWSYNYDEWIDSHSHRLLKQWNREKGIEGLKLFNRIDVRDVKGKWLEAHVVHIEDMLNDDNSGNGKRISVHFKGWAKKWDETIEIRNN